MIMTAKSFPGTLKNIRDSSANPFLLALENRGAFRLFARNRGDASAQAAPHAEKEWEPPVNARIFGRAEYRLSRASEDHGTQR
jgi:hypothetical protein